MKEVVHFTPKGRETVMSKFRWYHRPVRSKTEYMSLKSYKAHKMDKAQR